MVTCDRNCIWDFLWHFWLTCPCYLIVRSFKICFMNSIIKYTLKETFICSRKKIVIFFICITTTFVCIVERLLQMVNFYDRKNMPFISFIIFTYVSYLFISFLNIFFKMQNRSVNLAPQLLKMQIKIHNFFAPCIQRSYKGLNRKGGGD